MEKPHKRLQAWKTSMELVTEVYPVTKRFPADERYGLASQMRRAAVSVASNIAEGAARSTRRDFVNFLHTARASLSELDTQFEIGVALGYVQTADRGRIDDLMIKADRMLAGLIKSLRARTTA